MHISAKNKSYLNYCFTIIGTMLHDYLAKRFGDRSAGYAFALYGRKIER